MEHDFVLRALDLVDQNVFLSAVGEDRQQRHQPLALRPHNLAIMAQIVLEFVARFFQFDALFIQLVVVALERGEFAAAAWSCCVSAVRRSDCLLTKTWLTMQAARAMPPITAEIARRVPVEIDRRGGTIRGTTAFAEAICWAQAMKNCSWVERSSRRETARVGDLFDRHDRWLHAANAWRPRRPTPAGRRR